MSGTPPTITITRAKGQPGQDPGVDHRKIIVGTSSAIPGSAGAISGPYYTPSALVADFGIGDGVDCGTQALTVTDDNPSPPGIWFLSTKGMSGLTAGVRGTVDNTAITGTAVPTKTTGKTPEGTYEPRVRVADDGAGGAGTAIGTAGIFLEASLDNGRTWLPRRALGTATSFEIAIPNPGGSDYLTGCKYDFQPSSSNKSALFTKLTLLQTTMTGTGHFVLTAGSVHLAADTTNDTALAAVPAATTDATCITLFNACLTYLGAHGADLTAHTIADATLAAALALIPTASNVADVDLYLDDLIAAYNAHRINTTGTVHGAADSTNTITAYTSAPGTLKTGDYLVESITTPPDWAVADMYTAGSPGTGALMTIANYPQDFGMIIITEPFVAGDVATISAGMTQMKAVKGTSRITLLGRMRDENSGETDATYIAAGVTFRTACADEDDIALCAGHGWLTDAFRSYVYLRSFLPALVARLQGMSAIAGRKGEKVAQAPGWTARGPLVGFTLRDPVTGDQLGHDERYRGGLIEPVSGKGGFITCYYEAATFVAGTYVCVDAPTLFGVSPTVRTLMDSRVSNGIERTLYETAFTFLGGADVVQNGTLDEDTRDAMATSAMADIKRLYSTEIANADDPNLVSVDPTVTTSGAVDTVTWNVADSLYFYTNGVTIKIANKRG